MGPGQLSSIRGYQKAASLYKDWWSCVLDGAAFDTLIAFPPLESEAQSFESAIHSWVPVLSQVLENKDDEFAESCP
jgi:hypothetical protein